MRAVFLALMIVSGAVAQVAIVPLAALCPAGQFTIATQTGTLGASALVKFSCLKIDPATVIIDNSTSPPTAHAGLPPEVIGVGFAPTNEVPAGKIDGVNRAFALSRAPIAPSIMVFLDGILQTPTQINIVGTLITFVKAPAANSAVIAFYWGE